jgi:hypothetical protein
LSLRFRGGRLFAPFQAGSLLTGKVVGRPTLAETGRFLKADSGGLVAAHIFVGSKASWDHIPDDAPKYQEWPSKT